MVDILHLSMLYTHENGNEFLRNFQASVKHREVKNTYQSVFPLEGFVN